MANVGHSAKLYQERRQPNVLTTLRGPGPQLNLADNAVHAMQLEPPLPKPALLDETCKPKDGLTQVWPHGDLTAP